MSSVGYSGILEGRSHRFHHFKNFHRMNITVWEII